MTQVAGGEPAAHDEGEAPPAGDDAAPVESDAGTTPEPAPRTFDLVVSFISPGDGTDGAAYDRLQAIVAKTKGLEHVRGDWGKEGEHDECFALAALTEAKRKDFVAKVRASMAKSTKVNIAEHAECRDERP